jgi:hypothetical protein
MISLGIEVNRNQQRASLEKRPQYALAPVSMLPSTKVGMREVPPAPWFLFFSRYPLKYFQGAVAHPRQCLLLSGDGFLKLFRFLAGNSLQVLLEAWDDLFGFPRVTETVYKCKLRPWAKTEESEAFVPLPQRLLQSYSSGGMLRLPPWSTTSFSQIAKTASWITRTSRPGCWIQFAPSSARQS